MSGYADPHATQTQPIAIGERGGPPEIVKTANPELFNQLLGGK